MRRGLLSLAVLGGVAALTACGSADVVIQAQTEGEDGETMPIEQLEVQALPYDRDAIFDSLEAAYSEPEPEIPDSLTDLQTRMAQAQEAWREAETLWNASRDSLRTLRDAMDGMARNSAEYRLAFMDFSEQEEREAAARRRSEDAFAAFDSLQQSYNTQTERLALRREQWADQAFAGIGDIIAARLEELGREEITDTTDANGAVTLSLEPGQWWIHTRYNLLFDELYWNVPIDAQRGDPITVTLDRSTAEIRPQF